MSKITGNEKAFLGGIVSGLVTLIVQLQQSGQFTTKEAVYSVAAYLATHAAVWLTTNSPQPPTYTPPVAGV